MEIILDMKDCLTFDDARAKPVRASGFHWIPHKLNATKRILSKYDAYMSHIAPLLEEARGMTIPNFLATIKSGYTVKKGGLL